MNMVMFNHVTLDMVDNRLLDAVDWQIKSQDRIALVGRNGAGKSSLLKVLQGTLAIDSGCITQASGLRVASLPQELPLLTKDKSVYRFLVEGLNETGELLAEFHRLSLDGNDLKRLAFCQQQIDAKQLWDVLWRVDMMANRLDINPNQYMHELSGGMKRRVLLAAALIAAPDLLLLDEPTNHLDVDTIEWLESYLKVYHGSLVIVTHDRAFLAEVASRIVEIDRGKLYSYQCDYETYLDRREARWLAEEKQNTLFDKRLADEEVWIRTGIKARRTRNEGRVRALKAIRNEYKARKCQTGKIKTLAMNVTRSGSLVFDVDKITYTVGEKTLLQDFSLLLTRGEKLGIIGPNGCGKTTLVRLLLGELTPDSGTIKCGTSLDVTYFDQMRCQLNEQETVMANVGGGTDYVTINGKQTHVATYLRDFLFPKERFNQLVSTLSGGERSRLLLAKLLAKPLNLLVMDEPTNDLDIETLELLESKLLEYRGTLLLISHDRAFINQVVTSVLVWEGNGVFNEYVGGYDDYRSQKQHSLSQTVALQPVKRSPNSNISAISGSRKLSFNEQRELSLLPEQIEQLEKSIVKLQLKIAESNFYQQDKESIEQYFRQLTDNEAKLKTFYQRWEFLENLTS